MKVFRDKASISQYLTEQRKQGKSIGFVPTMGALHEGHLSLIRSCRAENDLTVCSIYVNPTQFDNSSDLTNYPRTWDSDAQLLIDEQCEVAFVPTDLEMYPEGTKSVATFMYFGELEQVMEGKHRKGHFAGVGLVVSKLFNIIRPDRAYFGQKDLQQFAIINRMAQDLSFNIELNRCPIVREYDGLAMSSRNVRLTESERALAPELYRALDRLKYDLKEGMHLEEAKNKAISAICRHKDFKIEYLETVDTTTLQPIQRYERSSPVAVCVAAHLGSVRLIDNLVIEAEP